MSLEPSLADRLDVGRVLDQGKWSGHQRWLLALTALTIIFDGADLQLLSAAVLASEFTPGRYRPVAVTLTIVCVPLGGTLAGLLAIQILPALGWRTLFVIGGGPPP